MKISVALCTYNGEQFINEQLDSILNQTLAVDEIVVCDDGSTDKTIKIIKQYQDNFPKIIQLIENEINLKSVKNFEKAISLCSGEIIFLSDQDDIWVADKVEKYRDYFLKNPTIHVLASNGYCIDENSIVHEKYSLWDVPEFLKEIGVKIDYKTIISCCSNIATGASMAIRKEIVSDIMPFPIIKDYHHDEWIAFIASSKNSFKLINDKLFYYRIHEKQQVGNVFFKKDTTTKNNLLYYFNLSTTKHKFKFYKKKLSRLVFGFKKTTELLNKCNPEQIYIFEKHVFEIKKRYFETVSILKKKFPVQFFILKCSDKIQGKQKRVLK